VQYQAVTPKIVFVNHFVRFADFPDDPSVSQPRQLSCMLVHVLIYVFLLSGLDFDVYFPFFSFFSSPFFFLSFEQNNLTSMPLFVLGLQYAQ
jgi:hypothetical protein